MSLGIVVVIAAFGIGTTVYRAARHMPSTSHLVASLDLSQGSWVYDSQGHLVTRLHGSVTRVIVPSRHIAAPMKEALVAVEDHNFYHNHGFDLRSMVRATLVDVLHRAPVQGASTITEQLAKDLYLSPEKSLVRKIQEFWLGLELSHRYSKSAILAMYLNQVYFGQGADGIYAASEAYFDESPSHLTLAQASMLAGLPQAPSLYDPLVHYGLARKRQWQVLSAMARYGDISPARAKEVFRQGVKFHPGKLSATHKAYPDPWYIDQVILTLRHKGYSMTEILDGGLKIYTALRPKAYHVAQEAVDQTMNQNFGVSKKAYPNHQAATVVEDPKTGDIWAIIGGRTHFSFLQDDFATSADRSTGSAIKPLLDYAPALARGYTQMSVIQDVPIFHNVQGQAWWPSNDDHIYRGYMTLRDALAISDNNVAVHLLRHIGPAKAVRFVNQRFGLRLPPSTAKSGLGIALGVDTNPLRMTDAYGAFADHGLRMTPIFVTRVVKHGKVVLRDRPSGHRAVTSPVAFIMTQMLERVLTPQDLLGIGPNAQATGYKLGIGRPAAGKTGTNNNEADAWFVGYEPQMVVGVWEGNYHGEIAQRYTVSGRGPAYGAVAAGPIWKRIMIGVNKALKLKPEAFARPRGVTYVSHVSTTSGELASALTPSVDNQGAWFVNGTAPTRTGHTQVSVKVAANDPVALWQPGCGPYITTTFLKPESDWKPGVPKPWDAQFWPPSVDCSPLTPGGPPGHQHRPHGPGGGPPGHNHKKHG